MATRLLLLAAAFILVTETGLAAFDPPQDGNDPVPKTAREKNREELQQRIAQLKSEVQQVKTRLAERQKECLAAGIDDARLSDRDELKQKIVTLIALETELQIIELEANLAQPKQDESKEPSSESDEIDAILQSSREEVIEKLITLTALETELQMDILGKRAQYQSVKEMNPNQMVLTPEWQKERDAARVVRKTQKALDVAEKQLNEYLKNDGKDKTKTRRLDRRRKQLENRLDGARSLALVGLHNRWLHQMWDNLTEAEDQQEAVRERLIEARAELQELDVKEAERMKKLEESKK